VVDSGTLDQLLARQPLFQAMWARMPAPGATIAHTSSPTL